MRVVNELAHRSFLVTKESLQNSGDAATSKGQSKEEESQGKIVQKVKEVIGYITLNVLY